MYRLGKIRILIGIGAAVALAACQHAESAKVDGKPTLPQAKTPAVVAFFDACPLNGGTGTEVAPLAAGLIMAFAGAAIPLGVDLIGDGIADALEARADALKASTTAGFKADLWTAKGNSVEIEYGCLVFMRGGFKYKDTAPILQPAVPKAIWDLATDGNSDIVKKAAVKYASTNKKLPAQFQNLVGAPEIYIELPMIKRIVTVPANQQVVDAEGKPALDANKKPMPPTSRAQPLVTAIEFGTPATYYVKSGAERNSDAKRLVLTVTVTAEAPNDKGKVESQTILDHSFDLGQHKPPAKVEPSDVVANQPPVQMPVVYPYSRTVQLASADAKSPDNLFVKTLSMVPLTVRATLTESEEGGDLERLLAKTLRDKDARKKAAALLTDELGEALGQKKADAKK